jgi:hypothetical protein
MPGPVVANFTLAFPFRHSPLASNPVAPATGKLLLSQRQGLVLKARPEGPLGWTKLTHYPYPIGGALTPVRIDLPAAGA